MIRRHLPERFWDCPERAGDQVWEGGEGEWAGSVAHSALSREVVRDYLWATLGGRQVRCSMGAPMALVANGKAKRRTMYRSVLLIRPPSKIRPPPLFCPISYTG